MDRKHIEGKLRDGGYKLTPQRRAILEVLLEHRGRFVDAGEIYEKTRARHYGTNFSTVYRNLDILENLGIIHKTSIENGAAVYELIFHRPHHHHIICKKCGRTEIIDMCPLEQLIKAVEDKDFTLTGHKFELYGYCRDCSKNQ